MEALETRKFRVAIDPGHGGSDSGASRGPFKESHITLDIALKVREKLPELYRDSIEIFLTRTEDSSLSLEQRVKSATNLNSDLFISLHANSSSSLSVNGMEFYFKKGLKHLRPYRQLPQGDMKVENVTQKEQNIIKTITDDLIDFGHTHKSLKFNQILQRNLLDSKTIIKRAPFYVIEKNPIPSVLIEVGYISNLSEAKKLLTEQRQSEIAETIIKTILDFKDQF